MEAMHPKPVTPEGLVELIADLCATAAGDGLRLRVAVDGHPATGTERLADEVAAALQGRGTAALRVSTRWFLRPASLRYEFGKQDVQSYAESWLDVSALRREVLDPLATGGSGRWLPTLWDPVADRATRAAYESAPERAVLLVDGPLLLGTSLPFDLTVHLHLSAAARQRRTSDDEKWTLPAYDDYDKTVRPNESADVVVRADDARHPAIVLRRHQ
jgi:hypothetical protein